MKNEDIISSEKQKELLLDMLLYIDNICRNNNIKYSLLGGTMIGAVRHKGFIPWDDDIDIVLDKDNYNKLINILKSNNNDMYDIFLPNETYSYPLQFAKLINTKTILKEKSSIDEIKNYGLFLDIFTYNNVPDEEDERIRHYNKCHYYQNSLVRVKLNAGNPSFLKKIKRLTKNIYLSIFGYKKHLKKLLELYDKYSMINTKFVMSNNPVYGISKEIQYSDDIKEYIDIDFEGHKVMIFKNYDNILKRSYGDYMKLPPECKRINHNLEVYWKNGKETKK